MQIRIHLNEHCIHVIREAILDHQNNRHTPMLKNNIFMKNNRIIQTKDQLQDKISAVIIDDRMGFVTCQVLLSFHHHYSDKSRSFFEFKSIFL